MLNKIISNKKLLLSYSSSLVIKFSALIFSIFTTRWVIQNFTGSEYESYNYIISYTQIILQIIDLGIPILLHKYFTNTQNISKLQNVYTSFARLRLFSYFFAIILIILSYPLSRSDNLIWVIGIFTGQFVILSDTGLRSIFDSKNISWKFSLTDLISKILLTLLIFPLLTLWPESLPPVYIFLLAGIISYTTSYCIDLFLLRKYTFGGRFDEKIILNEISTIKYLAISTIIVAFFLNVDKLYLGYFNWGEKVVGGYSVAYKLFELVGIVPALLLPPISSLLKNKLDNLKNDYINQTKIFQEFVVFTVFSGVVLFIFLRFGSQFVVKLLDSENKYPLALDAINILAFAIIPMIPMLLIRSLTIFYGKEKYELISVIALLFIANGFYFLLIPKYGLVGASLATVLSYFVDLIIKSALLFRAKPHLFKLKITSGD